MLIHVFQAEHALFLDNLSCLFRQGVFIFFVIVVSEIQSDEIVIVFRL